MSISDKFERLRQRRYDPLNFSYDVQKNFSNSNISESTRYIYESMQPISEKYRKITIGAADRVKKHLQNQFNSLNYIHSFRYQGSATTNTEIAIHSDIDLLLVQNDFFYLTPSTSRYTGDATNVMKNVQMEIYKKLDSHYSEVKLKPKNIKVDMHNPKRQVDVVPATYDYGSDSTKNTGNAGIVIYNNGKYHNKSFPFTVTDNINSKARFTKEASRRLIRYLKNIKEDSDLNISLTSFEIYAFVHEFQDSNIWGLNGVPLSFYLKKEIDDYLDRYKDCESIASPCSTETPFRDNTSHFYENMSMIKEELEIIHSGISFYDKFRYPKLITEGLEYA